MDDEWELFQKSMKEETVVSTRARPETGFMFSVEKTAPNMKFGNRNKNNKKASIR